ncbi:MAG: hypothetical protein OWT28_12685 [Firmicutes bacterium]|nr:hypothetical protein [Bacillota bacterium]
MAQSQGPTLINWVVAFLILYVRFMLVPVSHYGTFLNLIVIVTILVIPSDSASRFAVTRVLFLLAVFLSVENFQYNDDEAKNEPSILMHP